MPQAKRKSFSFDETDIEWINPLILEWVKENEGKKQGDLIKELLRDYKKQRGGKRARGAKTRNEVVEPVEGEKADYIAKVGDVLSDTSVRLRKGATKLQGQLRVGYEQLSESIGKLDTSKRASEALNVASEKLKSGGQQVSSGLKKGYEQILGSIKRRKDDAAEEENA